MDELDWLPQSPNLNRIEHLWDELERQLQASLNRPTSVPDLTNALVAEWKPSPRSNVPMSSGKPPQKSGGCYSSKGGTNFILMLIIFLGDVRRAGVHIFLITKNTICTAV